MCFRHDKVSTECWTLQSSHRDTFFFIYIYMVVLIIILYSSQVDEASQFFWYVSIEKCTNNRQTNGEGMNDEITCVRINPQLSLFFCN